MSKMWERILPRVHELADLDSALRLLSWDQHVMMPAAASGGRARVMATLQALAHQRLTDPELGDLLSEAEADETLTEDEKASLRLLRRDQHKATRLPERLVREMAELEALAFQAWAEARPANDFSILEPHLSRMVALKKEAADAIGWESERYDALIDDFEPGTSTAEVEALFEELVPSLKPVAEKILASSGERPAFLSVHYDVETQRAFCEWLVEQMGFKHGEGRFDISPHPFTVHIGASDVRQTTRYESTTLLMSIRASMHETGHALYEQGIPKELLGLPIGDILSLGIHESQSRIWEIQVGTGRPFLEFVLPQLKERFPGQLASLDPDEFYRGVNHPRRSLIRVQADEVTYNLHIALRFEIELALFRDELSVADLPDAFDAAMEKYVGIRPDTQSDGVLQDMHWAVGALGYFPTYSLGTLYAAALFEKAQDDLGGLDDELRQGDTSRLLSWLRENIHIKASRRSGKETAEEVIGGPLSPRPFLDHLKRKYSEIYDISF
ncbi:MAG TPA: carboxypeptidase M32 [Actinomycetota bacterium]|nr:carboxypeptidase M32 [Actinomycetota bacterium]